MKLKTICPKCKKEVKSIQSEFTAFGKKHYIYNCGHIELFDLMAAPELVSDQEVSDLLKEEQIKYDEEAALDVFSWEAPLHEIPVTQNPIPEIYWAVQECEPYFCKECKIEHNRKHLFPFQRDGVTFILKSQCRALN